MTLQDSLRRILEQLQSEHPQPEIKPQNSYKNETH